MARLTSPAIQPGCAIVSVRFGSIKELLYRSQGAGDTVPHQDPLTVSGWMFVYRNIRSAGPLFARYANATGTERSGAFVNSSGMAVIIEATASTGDWSTGEPLKLGVWQFWAYRRNGRVQELLLDGTVVRAARGAPATDTSAAFVFGCTSTEYVDGQFARWRIWESALTDAEILAEKHAAKAVRPGAWADYPMANDDWAADAGAHVRRLRTAGSLRNGSSEPLAIVIQPTDQTAARGAAATFTVVPTGSGLTYQWQDDRSGEFDRVRDGKGGDTTSYTTAAIEPAFHGRRYRVVVTDASGRTISAAARLTVLGRSAHAWSGMPTGDDRSGWRFRTTVGGLAALFLAASVATIARRIALANVVRSTKVDSDDFRRR